jgi:hypothetical protein
MVPLGLWIAIVGYGVLYAGVMKLGGAKCSLAQAFRGQCTPAPSSSQAGASSSSQTPVSSGPITSSSVTPDTLPAMA